MTMKDSARKLLPWVKRWARTLLSGAPEGMEHVTTEYHREQQVTDPAVVRELLAPYLQLLDEDRHDASGYQIPEDGIGKLYHREYRISFETDYTPESIVLAVTQDLNRFTNPTLARFEKTRGASNGFEVGDRYDIIITGPWDGPVEVVDRRPGQFSFVTRKGHLESGFITFRVTEVGAGNAEFLIRSWATCSDLFVWLSYTVLGLSKNMQTKMWRFFCLKVAQEFGGKCTNLTVKTYKIPLQRG